MDVQHHPVRHTTSVLNPALVESWCLDCGLFIAASNDPRKLKTAEESHMCLMKRASRPHLPAERPRSDE